MSERPPTRAVTVALIAAAVACFDSDQTFRVDEATSTGPAPMPATSTSSSTSGFPTTGPGPQGTCEDAIDCIFGCAGMLLTNPMPEPDLSCFIDCIETEDLSEEEAKNLLEFGNCASDLCAMDNQCPLGETGSSTGDPGGSSSTTGGSSSSSSSTTMGAVFGGGAPELDPCLQCIFLIMRDEGQEGPCRPFADICYGNAPATSG